MPSYLVMNDGGRGLFAQTQGFADRATAGLPLTGTGTLSGSSPAGLATLELAPVACEIRVHYRPKSGAVGDGLLAATTFSAADGTWEVAGLDMNKRYDVIARYPGYNDVIMSDVAPYRAPSTQTLYPSGYNISSPGQNPMGLADVSN